MAYGVDKHPNPPEYPDGHWEYDVGDDGQMIRFWVKDYDDDGNPINQIDPNPEPTGGRK